MVAIVKGLDGKPRCRWYLSAPEFLDYHDKEWVYPVDDDQRLFEKICLEGFQAGLSWRTILVKRENFRKVFMHFDFNKIANFKGSDVEQLLQNKDIIRNRSKIEAVIHNARCAQKLVEKEGSLAKFFWKFEPDAKHLSEPQSVSISKESTLLSKELKKRGWKFVGPTTACLLYTSPSPRDRG